ncbi:MAG TPA: hypothetical protein PK228_03370, partial [Saprospiraceae bacterium]|nr:hypothetical protein [Saprospiraceae bacterium]
EWGYVSHLYEFKKGKKFRYEKSTCTGGFDGTGRYEISNDTIVFRFDPFEPEPARFKITRSQALDSSVVVHLCIEDAQNGCFLRNYQANLYAGGKLLSHDCGDRLGSALIWAKGQDSVTLHVSHLNFSPFNLTLEGKCGYSIYLELEPKPDQSFQLLRFTKDTLILGFFDYPDFQEVLVRDRREKKRKGYQ